MRNVIIGTAGHIDHGKTTLIQALTGIDADRLKEEKMRGITIDLGFAYLRFPNGDIISFIDVPGHERFIKNMLAGASGIDAALLVVGADEGVMPQTREHLEIISLLEIEKIIIVITKTDLVEDEMLYLVEEDIKELLKDTPYMAANLVKVSAINGNGIVELRNKLETILQETLPTKGTGIVRLPIDRVFKIQGFGTVVTGTLHSGVIKIGDNLDEVIKNKKARVRNLQVHNKKVEIVQAGQRAAINLAGIESGELKRGDVLVGNGKLLSTMRIDVDFKLLESAPPLSNNTRIRFYQGTEEVMGRILFVNTTELVPGERAFVQIVLEKPVVLVRGDKFVVRCFSPLYTIGGGRVVEPYAERNKKNSKTRQLELEVKASGKMDLIVMHYLNKANRILDIEEIALYLGKDIDTVWLILSKLIEKDNVILISQMNKYNGYYVSKEVLMEWEKAIKKEIDKYLKENPLELGVNKEHLRIKYWPKQQAKEFNSLLQYWLDQGQFILNEGRFLAPGGYVLSIDNNLQDKINNVERLYEKNRWNPPDWERIKILLKINSKEAQGILQYLLRTQKLIQLSEELYILKKHFDEAKTIVVDQIQKDGKISVGTARDVLGATRRMVVPLLEYFDTIKVTIRKGDVRVLYHPED